MLCSICWCAWLEMHKHWLVQSSTAIFGLFPVPLFFCWPDRLLNIVFQIRNALTSIKINYSYICASLVISAGKESTCNAGDPRSIPGSRSSPGEGIGYPLQYSWASLVAQTVKNLPAMWETWIWSLGWENPWRRAWQPTPVFLPGESHGQRSLEGYSPRCHEELDMAERLSTQHIATFR